ncbi:MAG: cell division ATP-binding protein FtsE [Pseudomonadota bacterium]
MVHLSHVYKTFVADKHVLKNVQLQIGKGEFVFLMGPSGAGKTTLFRIITGFDQPTSGEILVNNFKIGNMTAPEMARFRRSIGVVFQDFKLLYDRSIFENVALPLHVCGDHQWEVMEKVEKILRRVGLGSRMNESPIHLSGGEKQRVAIARALVHEPDFVIADEPTGNLDWRMSSEIMDLFKEANDRGTTLIIATHDKDIISQVKKPTIIKIENGQIFNSGEEAPCGSFFKPLQEAGLSIL